MMKDRKPVRCITCRFFHFVFIVQSDVCCWLKSLILLPLFFLLCRLQRKHFIHNVNNYSKLKTKCLFNCKCQQQYKRWSDVRSFLQHNFCLFYRKEGDSWGKWAKTGSYSAYCIDTVGRDTENAVIRCLKWSCGDNLIFYSIHIALVPGCTHMCQSLVCFYLI